MSSGPGREESLTTVSSQAGQKGPRCEAREKPTSEGVLKEYVGARRSSATKQMGLFRRSAEGPVERLDHDPTSPWWGIHLARYMFASPYASNRRTLDIACGTGYGLPQLQARARCVVGVDLDDEAVRAARAELNSAAGGVLVADAGALPFKKKSFELITSFETLEHLKHRKEFLAELSRVMSRDGLCILSTPNADRTLPVNGTPRNPHHLHEYTPAELEKELRSCFAEVEMMGQTLDRRFIIPPFWDEQQQLPPSFRVQAQLLLWRVLNKLPSRLRDRLSLMVWGHPFLPSEADYRFSLSGVEEAPVLVALCKPI